MLSYGDFHIDAFPEHALSFKAAAELNVQLPSTVIKVTLYE